MERPWGPARKEQDALTASLRIGISSGHFEWATPAEAFERCRSEWGFDVLEIWSDQIGFSPDADTADALRRLSAKHNIALGYHAPFVGDYDLAQSDAARSGRVLRELLGVTNRIHAEFLIVHLGANPEKEVGLRCAMSAVSQNRSLIEKQGIRIALEVVPAIWGNQIGDAIEDFEQIFRTIDKPWLGLNLDYGHAQLNGNLDAVIERLGHKIIYAHVQDTRGEVDEHLGYGMGAVDWTAALSATLRTGFRGPFVIEYPESHGVEVTERFLGDLRRLSLATEPDVP